MNALHTWKTQLQNIFYFYHHVLAGGIILIGGLVAFGILYLFLFTSAPVEQTPSETNQAAIKQDALERITIWSKTRKEDAKKTFTIPSSAFVVPPSAP